MIRLVTLLLLLAPIVVSAQFLTGRETSPGRWIWSYNAQPIAIERRGPHGRRVIVPWDIQPADPVPIYPVPQVPLPDPFYDPWIDGPYNW